jgi:hypothetical protein
MSQHRVRIVVGEGRSARMGFLRFVLQSEGYQVVAQASSSTELARVLAEHQPDVVVLDDGIGATAVQMTHEISPSSKVILVWPGAVVPIGGDARVEPSEALRSLGPAVAKAVGPISASFETISKPAWVDRVRKDPATLRERLDQGGGLPTERPSITELQRQVHFDEPEDEEAERAEGPTADEPTADEPLAPVLPLARVSLPPAVWASTIDLDQEEAGERGAAVAAGSEGSEWNRRLGMIALGGAVAASAVVVALALGSTRGKVGILSASGTFPQPAVAPVPGAALANSIERAGTISGLDGLFPSIPQGPTGGPGGPHGGGTTGGGGTGGNTGGGGGGTGGGGGVTRMPGNSALHNPFGGPPGQASTAGGTGPGNSAAAHAHAGQRGNSANHASQNGLAHRHKR